MATKRQYTSAVKIQAVEAVLGGAVKAEVLEELDIKSIVTLEEWIRIHKQNGPEALERKPRGRGSSSYPTGPA